MANYAFGFLYLSNLLQTLGKESLSWMTFFGSSSVTFDKCNGIAIAAELSTVPNVVNMRQLRVLSHAVYDVVHCVLAAAR